MLDLFGQSFHFDLQINATDENNYDYAFAANDKDDSALVGHKENECSNHVNAVQYVNTVPNKTQSHGLELEEYEKSQTLPSDATFEDVKITRNPYYY